MNIYLSIVIPIYNEEKNIPELYKQLKPILKKLSSKHEIIYINDGSRDNSLSLLKSLRRKDKKVKIINFSRNFGHMAALSAGLTHATGKKVVIMDADLQDPPKVIPEMYKKSHQGYDVVYAVKKDRKESVIKRLMFSTFYTILNSIAQFKMPPNAGTFSLIDKKIAKIINSLPEKNRYFSGLRFWTGFSQTEVIYERQARFAGKSIPLRKHLKLAMDGMISFSHIPLKISSLLGFIFAIISSVLIIIIVLAKIFFGIGIIGWASTMSTILFVGSLQLLTLGIIGEYLARIYDEVKSRPEYIVSEKIGF
ncbi:glycosyltransferase [candidate division WWE3 bacterium RIFOXYC1_FULL_39_7]|uniref:Glycosyltransferase n=1 Tax=candidate division WWE3 bacterium RIFOXYC1_FULL_39_7 TaxID=1802643 RepID=A0A1F4WI61_UNCKA|nr:MAG: glycosyltransferase [candidate division WWE3 bacterium RIFOXYC1_FULL_39_7]